MVAVFLFGLALLGLASLLGCEGHRGQSQKNGGGTITLTVSDPATCGGANGPFSHVYVTISHVQLSNPGAVPPTFADLGNSPTQLDLLGSPNRCFLATLGSNLSLPPGNYTQINVLLAPDGTTIAGNHCGLAANCVMLSNDPLNTPHAIQLGSETTQGIKLTSSQIAGGGFNALAFQPQTLNLNFDACASVISFGTDPNNPQFRFKPVLLAGDTGVAPGSLPSSISGTVVNQATQLPIPNGHVIVALEQTDNRGVDRVLMETLADPQGKFSFCPVLPGTYDVVVSATDSRGGAFAASVTLGVPQGKDLGNVPMIAVAGVPNTPAAISGTVDTSNGSSQPTSADISLSALQQVPLSAASGITIPASQGANAATIAQATENSATCPANFDCSAYSFQVPPTNPNVGAFSSGGTAYTQGSGSVSYTIEAIPFAPLSGTTPDCSPSFLVFGPTPASPGGSTSAPPLIFGGCQ
jgi:Domain of unknown function (DUF4382)